MNIDEFKLRLESASSDLDTERLSNILDRSLAISTLNNSELPRGYINLLVVMEEASELIQSITKQLRSGTTDTTNILEEMADVLICLEYLKKVYGIKDTELIKAINVKLERLDAILTGDLKGEK